MTIDEAIDMITRGETPEQYKKRTARIRRLANERDDLEDSIQVLKEYGDSEKDMLKLKKKQERLIKVLEELDRIK